MASESQKRASQNQKMEWISLVYLIFFVLAVMSPSLVSRGLFGLEEAHVEELLIFLFGLAGLVTFLAYNRIMDHRMRERDTAVDAAARAKRELIDSYKYIGQVNRQIEMLKNITNQTSMTLVDADAYRKDLLQSIVSNAAAVCGSQRALLRFVDLTRLRTESETYHAISASEALKISNKELRGLHESGASHAFILADDGSKVLAVSSDRKLSAAHAFLIFGVDEMQDINAEVSLLKVFANQAELVFFNLQKNRDVGQTSPLQLVEAVTSAEAGEVN